MSEPSRWQREDGFPSDAYFKAVVDAIRSAGLDVADWFREEAWEWNLELAPESFQGGRLGSNVLGLFISWRCDEHDEPTGADDFTGFGWYWVPYSRGDSALGDFAKEFEELPWLAEPSAVADAVVRLVRGGPRV